MNTFPGRITGLDPAKPFFDAANSTGRLDSDDAMFVDVIHTHGGLVTMEEPVRGAFILLHPQCLLKFCNLGIIKTTDYRTNSRAIWEFKNVLGQKRLHGINHF